jgi:membrane-associated phospholipid phosphatase
MRGPWTREPWGGIRHPTGLTFVTAVALAASYAVAVQDPVPNAELRLTEWINDVPDAVGSALYPIMQAGTLGGPIVVAVGIAVFRRDWFLSGAAVVAGLVAWFGAKGVKRVVERDRPLAYLPDIAIREGDGSGLGYVSGHSAVAATAAMFAMAALPRRWRFVPPAIAVLVGVARVVHGVHLPADLLGGWSIGILVSMGTFFVIDRISPTTATAT